MSTQEDNIFSPNYVHPKKKTKKEADALNAFYMDSNDQIKDLGDESDKEGSFYEVTSRHGDTTTLQFSRTPMDDAGMVNIESKQEPVTIEQLKQYLKDCPKDEKARLKMLSREIRKIQDHEKRLFHADKEAVSEMNKGTDIHNHRWYDIFNIWKLIKKFFIGEK